MWTWSAHGPSHVTVHVTKSDCFTIIFFTVITFLYNWTATYYNYIFCYNLVSSFTSNRFFMSISFFSLVRVSNSLISHGWAPRMNPKTVPFVRLPYGHKSVPFLNFFFYHVSKFHLI